MRNLRYRFGSALVFLPIAVLPAQTPQHNAAVVIVPLSSPSCPVGLSARHAKDGGLITVYGSNRSPRGLEHGYTVSFDTVGGHAIAQARITLRGLVGGQFLPAGEGRAANATETFTVAPAAATHGHYTSVVYAEKLTGVQWVQLNEITYADGGRWHESPASPCRVAPNGFLLVASDR